MSKWNQHRAVLFLLFVAACGGDKPITPSKIALVVDPSLAPQSGALVAEDGSERPVAAFVGAPGIQADLMLNELVAITSDRAALEAFLGRWGGKIVATNDFAAGGMAGVPTIHHVQLDPSAADPAALLASVQEKKPEASGSFRVSSEAAQKLLAVALAEGASTGISLSPNWVLRPDDFAAGTTNEAHTGASGYTNDAFTWPYMTRGSAQDIGVGAAWQALLSAGRLINKVRILVLDGGFRETPDFPAVRSIHGASWNVRNPGDCGSGNPCPWHASGVVTALMGRADNSYGGVGPAAPVGELVAMQLPGSVGDWVTSIFGGWVGTVFGAAVERPRIINMSFSVPIDYGWEILAAAGGIPLSQSLSDMMTAIQATGTLIFASAGNAGRDVDNRNDVFEETLIAPCELRGVICVGGLGHDTTALAAIAGDPVPLSSFGTRTDDDSVDLYAPYFMWIPEFPTDHSLNTAKLGGGTSYSSPFVAGVAALVWAANPGLLPHQVWGILRDTANNGGVHGGAGHQRRINAYAAVRAALGGDTPPFIRIDSPLPNTERPFRMNLSFSATSWDQESTPGIEWRSNRDGVIGGGAGFGTSSLSVGTHTITATAASSGVTATATVEVNITNAAPDTEIVSPAPGDTFCPNETITFNASVADLNNPDGFPGEAIQWSSVPAGVSGTGATRTQSLSTAGSYTVTARATDDQGVSGSDSVTFTVASCTNSPPSVNITQPANAPGSGPDLVVNATGMDANGPYALVTLRGIASDPEDGTLSGSSLVWTTNQGQVQPGGSARLTSGATPTAVKLYSGCDPYFGTVEHVIRLTATDSGDPSGVPQIRSVTRVIHVKTLC